MQINGNGRNEVKIDARIAAAVRLYYALRLSFFLKRETKLVVFKKVSMPVNLYGSESWTLQNRLKSRIQTIEVLT